MNKENTMWGLSGIPFLRVVPSAWIIMELQVTFAHR